LLPNLLPDIIGGIKNTVFCHKKEIAVLKKLKTNFIILQQGRIYRQAKEA
jgi:hypothetical protein